MVVDDLFSVIHVTDLDCVTINDLSKFVSVQQSALITLAVPPSCWTCTVNIVLRNNGRIIVGVSNVKP